MSYKYSDHKKQLCCSRSQERCTFNQPFSEQILVIDPQNTEHYIRSVGADVAGLYKSTRVYPRQNCETYDRKINAIFLVLLLIHVGRGFLGISSMFVRSGKCGHMVLILSIALPEGPIDLGSNQETRGATGRQK